MIHLPTAKKMPKKKKKMKKLNYEKWKKIMKNGQRVTFLKKMNLQCRKMIKV